MHKSIIAAVVLHPCTRQTEKKNLLHKCAWSYFFVLKGLTVTCMSLYKSDEMMKVPVIVFVTCRFFLSLVKALWTKNGGYIVYPCHAIIISMDVSSGQQQFFMGHTDKV